MKSIIRYLTALLTAVSTAAACTSALYAESEQAYHFTPIYPLDQAAAGQIVLTASGQKFVSVQIYQHSPERDQLLLFDEQFTADPETEYIFSLEPGSYTVYCSASQVRDRGSFQTLSQDFTFENPDYNDSFDENSFLLSIVPEMLSDEETHEPVLGELTETTAAGIRQLSQSCHFYGYDRLRGDYNGDGEVNLEDAVLTLHEYVMHVVGAVSAYGNAAQLTACDINGNGQIESEDAFEILRYYTFGILGREQFWGDM